MQNEEQVRSMIRLIIHEELDQRGFLSKDQISDIAKTATQHTMNTTFRLMGIKFKDNGEVDFEHAHDNNDYVTRLRRGHNQLTNLIFNSCAATAVLAALTFIGHAILEYLRNYFQAIPPIK